jgi:hypothetical protein
MLALLARKICTKSLNNNMVMNLPKDTFLAGVQISPRRQMRQQSAKGGKKVNCTPVGTARQHNWLGTPDAREDPVEISNNSNVRYK